MKKLFLGLVLALALFCTVKGVEAKSYTSGYYRSSGTYVNSYYRTSPNAYKYDNYSYSSGARYNRSYTYPTRNYSSSWYTPYSGY